jgi:acyl carrier protein
VPSTFDQVADIVALTCQVPREDITPDSNLLADLGIDSLDLLDVGCVVDDAFGIRLPLEQWLHAVHMKRAAAERCFVMRDICASIDALAQPATA